MKKHGFEVGFWTSEWTPTQAWGFCQSIVVLLRLKYDAWNPEPQHLSMPLKREH